MFFAKRLIISYIHSLLGAYRCN